MATRDHTAGGDEITPAPRTLTKATSVADRRDVDEAKEASGGLVIASRYPARVLELIEASLEKFRDR
jgi:hypothetical protein